MIVMIMAITPSLNASSRPLLIYSPNFETSPESSKRQRRGCYDVEWFILAIAPNSFRPHNTHLPFDRMTEQSHEMGQRRGVRKNNIPGLSRIEALIGLLLNARRHGVRWIIVRGH
jgi:hypothetical protein